MLELFDALQYSAPLVAMRDSPWVFPMIASIHLLGLAMLGGAVLIVDLRLIGVGLVRQSAAELGTAAQPWLIGSLIVMLTTGPLLFMCFARKYYYLPAFWVKVTCLAVALVFTFAIRRRVVLASDRTGNTLSMKLVGTISLLLWATIALGGRLIGFP